MADTNEKPLYTLWKALGKNNYDVPEDYDDFEYTLTLPGEEGSLNRQQLYKSLYKNNYDVPDNYDDFANTLFVPAKSAQPQQVGQQAVQGNGRRDMVESLDKYYEGLQVQNAPQAPVATPNPASSPSFGGGGAASSWKDGQSIKTSGGRRQRKATQKDLYVDDKGNPTLGTSEEDSRDIERSGLYYPLMRNDSINLAGTEAFRKGWLVQPQLDKNVRFAEARAAGYKAQGERFKDLSDEQLVQAMREEEKKLDGSTSPESLQASMNVRYIETLMAAREWGLGDVPNFNATPYMVDYYQVKRQYNKNGLVDKYEKNMLTGRDDNPLLIRGWELIEDQYTKDEADGNLRDASYYRNLPFYDPKFAEEFGAYITARIKVTGERWNDAVKDAIDDFEAAAAEGRVGQRHSEEYLGSANRGQVDDMLDKVNAALKKRTGELDDKFMNESWFQRLGESSYDPESPSSRYLTDPDASNLIWAGRALQDAKKIIAAFDANRLEDGLTGFFKGAGRGLVDSLSDLSTWDGGISDLLSAQRLNAAVDKFKKGKPLSASEKALLDATSLKLATAEIFKEVGRGYKAGTVTGESLPFMVEMALNPIAKSGNKIASGLAKYANKYLGKYLKKMVSKLGRSSAGRMATRILGSGLAKNAGRVTARVVGDIGAAGGMAATSGLGHSAASAIGYHTGDVQYQQGAGGKTHFSGVTGGDDWVTSTLKGFGSTTIENASEMWGEYFKPITNFLGSVSGKALEKMHLGAITRWLNDVNSTEMARLMSDFRKQTRWDGNIAEYFEEVAGNIANALTVGDMNFSLHDKDGNISLHERNSVFNVDDNLDTFLGVSLMSGAMGSANIVGYRTPKYRAKQDVKRYGDMARGIFGARGNDWSTIETLIRDNSEEGRKQFVADLMQSGKYSKREKQAALQYAGAVYKSMGMDLGESKQKRSAGEQEAEEAYGRGYDMANLETIAETSSAYNQLRSQMEQEYGTELMERMDSEPGLVYGWVRAGAVSEEDAKKVLDYLNAKMAYEGAVDRLNDDDSAAKAAAETHVDDTIHTEENGGDGQIHPVTLKGRDGDHYVVSGNVVTDNNGKVDVDASDNEIVVVDSNGKRMMTTAKDIAQVGDTIDPNAAKAQAVASIESVSAQVSGGLDTGANQIEGDETLDGTDLDSDEVAAPDGATQQDASSIQAPLPVAEYNQDDLVTVEVDGQQVDGIVTNGLDSNGNVTLYLEEPINGRQNVQLTPEQLNQVAVSYTSRDGETIDRSVREEESGESGETPQEPQQPGAPAQEQTPVSGESEKPLQQPAANGELDVQTGETPQTPNAPVAEAPQQAPAQPSLPVGEDGNADFSNATTQEAHDYIYNDPELDEDEANQVVQNYADSAAEELAKAQAVLDELKSMPAPQMKDYGRDMAGYKRDKKERNDSIAQAQAAVDAAQREVDLWNGVQAQHMMNRAAAKAAANRTKESVENPAAPSAPSAPASVSGESENNAPTPSQATPPQGQQTTESTQEPSAPQPNEGNGPMASTSPATGVDTQPQEEDNEGDGEDQNPGDSGESASPEASGVETRELTPDERIERARMEALENRAEELADSCGLPVQVARSLDDLSDRHRREVEKQHAEGKYVNGFYDPMTKQIVLFLPDIAKNGGMRRLERTFLHEGVAHGGLRALFENAQNGIQTFDELCDQVWEMMPVAAQSQMMNYIGVQKPEDMTQEKKRIAADEYMAHLAEWGVEPSVKSRIITAIKNALRKIGVKMKLSNNDIVSLLAASRRHLNEMDKVGINSAISEALDNDGEGDGEGVRMSTTAIFEGAGLEVSRDATDNEGKPTKEPLTDSKGNLVARIGGKEYSVDNPVTAADLKEGDKDKKERTVLQMLINDAIAVKNITEKQADKIYQNYADLLNMYLYTGSAELGGPEAVISNWEWLGDSVFRTIAANGDAQYSYSMDIIRVCKKNEAVIKAMSALQLREGRGATPSEIVELYRETHEDGYQVPCPVCYVFTRYIRNGKYASAAIKGMEKWGDHLPGGSDVWSVDQWLDALDKIQRETNPDYKPDGKNKMKGEELEKAQRFKKQLDQANKITVAYEKRVNALSYLLTTDDAIKAGTIKNKKLELTPERRASIEKELDIINEQYQHAVEIIAHQALSNWIKTHAIEEKNGKWQMREDARKPEDIDDYKRNALDLRLTSNTIVNYPAIQRLRKSGGSAAGKEISFASDNRLGEVVSGLGINKSNLSGYKNKYEEALNATGRARNKARNEARKRFKDATVYALMQTLRGGQRMWSWSDNIERLSPDIAINIMQLQLLGGAMQTYSKQLEGIKLAAQMGAYVNGSLMAKDNGYQEVTDKDVEERDGKLWLKHDITDEVEEYPVGGGEPKPRKRIVAAKGSYVYQAEDGKKYVLIYDDVVGVDPFGNELHGKGKKKGLFQLNQEYDRAGNILVGMNDLHVRAAMADPRVFFIIPWHASGANNHILNQMLNILEQNMTDRLDYTAMQEEKNMLERNKNTKELPEVNQRLRDLWEEGRQWAKQYKWKSGMEVDSNGDVITESQYMYRQLRALIFNGNIFEAMPSEEQYRAAVQTVESMQPTVDAIAARNEQWKSKSPEYKKSPEGKAEKKAIELDKNRTNKKYKEALHYIELHDGLIDWRDSSQHEGDAEWQAQHPKRINVEEARRMIENDEFLSQVLKRVEPIGHMTNGDNTYIYPYEYWQETDKKGKPADIKDADINGKRYVEYCRRMGYKPKFSGRWGDKVTEENMNDGNFVHDPGYWKLLIDRRMYDRKGKYQWLDPVESENFEPDLVNPLKTGEEFNITQVADDKDAEDIAERVYNNMAERDGGVAKVDYSKPLDKIMDEYDASLAAGVQANVKLTDAETDALDDMEEAMEEEDSGVMFSTSPTFYSNAERAVENIKQNKATAEQWKAMLTKVGGIKSGEDKWMGLSQWLEENKGKSLSKGEVMQFIKDNSIEMEETTYSEAPQSFDSLKREYDQWLHDEGFDYAQEQLRERFGDDADIAFNDLGGELVIANEEAAAALLGSDDIINQTRLDYTTEGLENKREIAFVVPGVEPYQEGDTIHFGPENQGKAVMWVRFGETTDADGNRVLVIDEIQSNRHQDAREKGYKNPDMQKDFETYRQQLEDKYFEGRRPVNFFNLLKRVATPEEVERYKELSNGNNRSGVPAAPFEKNWQEVAMKRMLRLAAEEGFDKVAWTTGEQQAERYNMGRVVKGINATDWQDNVLGWEDVKMIDAPLQNDEELQLVVNKDGEIVADINDNFEGRNLSEVFGKEIAEKLMGDGEVRLDGDGLRIGGEGMKGFYDQMLPRFMDKYGKKWGVKTGEVELSTPGKEVMHAVDVTPEMKESVMQGQPLFSTSDVNEAMPRNTEQEREVDGDLRFSVREKPEPKKTIPVYKLMRLGDDGKLYPLFIDGTEPIELGVWYDADSPNMDMLVDLPIGVHLIDTDNGTSMTMEEYVKQNNIKLKKGQKYPPKEVIESTSNGQRWVYIEPTERGQRRFGGESRRYWNLGINGSGSVSTFSMRPGWHAGSLPTMRQIGKGAKKNLRDDRFVWVEGLISADIDYNEEAQGNPDNDIPTHIPTDGFYMKATNANAKASQADRVGWYISGAFMPVRIMSDSETRQVIDEWNQDHPDLQVEYDFSRESGKVFNAETMQLEDEANVRFSTGWHGSGSEFDRFDHSHMGEGEGAQAYGWGTYITSVEGIGRSYATESAKKNPTYYWKGQQIDRASINPLSMAYDVVEREGTIKKAISLVDRFLDNPDAHENWAEVKEILKQSKKSDFTKKPARYLYEVEIPDNNGENYISWNETLPKKHRIRIANVVRELPDDLLQRDTHGPNWLRGGFEQLANTIEREQYAGKEITERLRDAIGNSRAVSEVFSKAGFVGTEYPAQYLSGGRKDGAKNYVIYNEDDIEIKDRIRFSTSAAVAALKDDERVYNRMLGKVFSGVSNETRRGIVGDAMENRGYDFGAATEAWLMGLTDDEAFAQVPQEDWRAVKNALGNALRENGVEGTMTDNEARYVLWKAGQIEDGVFSLAEDIVMQDRLLPGDSGVRFSTSKVEQMTPIEKRYPDMEDFKDNTSILFHYKWATRHLDENFLRLVELDLDDISKDINSQKKYIKERPWAASEASKRKLEGLIKLRDNIAKELEQKGKAQGNNAWGIKRGTSFTFDQFDKLFKAHNSDPINAELWDKVLATSRALGIDNIKVVGNLGSTTSGASFGGRVRISEQYLNSYARSDNRKAETMLHEMIHHVTSYAFNAVKEKKDVPPHIADAVRTLNDVFNAIKSDPDFNGQYGKSDVYELVAELSNPEFREKLKEKNLWQKIVDGLMRLLGYEPREGVDKTTAYAEARAALEKLLESPDTDLYKEYAEDLAKYRPRFKMESEQENDLRFSVTPRDRAIARDQYERWMKSGRMQWLESMQDSMLGLKKLMQAIMGNAWTKVEDVAMYENPYIAENLMSSVTAAQQQAFYTEFMKPLLKEVSKLCKGGKKARERAREDLTNYLMAKHGLERNQVLADRDAQETAQAGGNYQDAYAENRERDYSGLTALTGEDDVHAAEAKAQQIVDDYEAQHDTTELWNKINAATQVTLEKQYKSGMLSYAEYQRISDMFEYYVPLRGWEETTSDEVYGYLTSKAGPFLGGGIVKRAEGRTSKADDPIATIAQMGDDSIRTGNRNLMKQTFLNFVQNHPSDAVSVSDLWLQYDAVTDEWVPVFADIDPNDSADVVEQKIQDFEQRMQELVEQEPDKYKHGREAANIPYRVVPGMEKEHQVLVKRNGQTWVLTINGNPRAAQALNGLTNPDVPMEGAWASAIRGAEWVNRTLSALYTTLSPAFIVSNFLRDSGYSNTMVWVRESPNYALRFNANYLKLNPATLRFLLGRWENGTLDENKPLQKHFKEFMLNGGETGFAMVKDLDKYKKDLLNEVKNMNSRNFVRKGMKIVGSQYELLGRSIENCARFAAYVTSREMGRDVKRSAYDAKEISVNFNKKGSGGKSLGKVGQTMSGNVGAFISGMARSLYTFWNAGVQGMTNAGRAVKRHPVKAALLGAGPLYAAGFLAPILAQLMGAGGDGDDDKNAYYNLPEYVRRSNLCIWLGDSWLTIPLPIEFRSIYGMGELTYGVISGNERYSDEELAMQVAGQFSQLLPIDMLEGGGGFHPFIPTLFKPIVEAEQNKSWSGLPIYRDSEWNKDEPEYTKAFSNANEWIVSGAEWLNAKTGGDEFKKGWIDLNPAKIEYMLKGYLGGIYTTIDEVRRAAETALGKRDFEWRNIPLANRVIKQGDERTESKKLRDEYFKYKDDYENTKRLINKYKNAEDTDLFDYAKKLDLLNNSKEYGRYLIFEKYSTMLEAYQKAKKGASGETLKKIEEDEKVLMRQLVNEMHAFEDGKLTVGDRPKLSKKDRSEDYGYMYNNLRTYVDINEDALLDSSLKRAKASGDKGMAAALSSIKRSIGEMKKGLGRGNDDKVMDSIRRMREGVLRSFGLLDGGEVEPDVPETEEPQEEWGDEGQDNVSEPEDDEFESFE